MGELKSLRVKGKYVNDNTKILMGMIQQLANVSLTEKQCFEAQYDLNLPFPVMEDLEKLNKKLSTDEECMKHFVNISYLVKIINLSESLAYNYNFFLLF